MQVFTGTDARVCVEAATKAPSIHNSQPWRFLVHPDAIEVYADLGRRLPAIDPDGRGMHVSLGAAVLNLRVAVARCGWHPHTRLLPDASDPRHVATVRIAGPRRVDVDDRELFVAVDRRHTNRGVFDDIRPPGSDLDELVTAAQREGAVLRFVPPSERDALFSLARTAELRQRRDPAYRAELRAWTTDDPYRQDGVPLEAVGPWSVMEVVPVRDFALDRELPGRQAARFELEPTVATLATYGDGPRHWLEAGQALQRVLLEATRRGLAVSLFTQPLEDRELRSLLRGEDSAVQVVLRVGYGWPAPASPRRPVEDVIVTDPRQLGPTTSVGGGEHDDDADD